MRTDYFYSTSPQTSKPKRYAVIFTPHLRVRLMPRHSNKWAFNERLDISLYRREQRTKLWTHEACHISLVACR